jgi:hypothetical protein
MKNFSKILTGAWVILSLLLTFPGVVNANGDLTIVVKNQNQDGTNQSWFSYQKKPGETINDVATVKNLGDQPVNAHVYPVDATSNSSGSFILRLEDEARTGIGSWTTIDGPATVTVPPQQSVDIPFHIQIPQDVTPGQYFGGLILEQANVPVPALTPAANGNTQQNCCSSITIKTRIGLRIYLTVPGIIKDNLEWSGFNTFDRNKNTNFQFTLKNSGNVALEPVATITIFDAAGNEIDEFQKDLGYSLPGTTTSPIVMWDKHPLIGNFRAVGKIDYTIQSASIGQQLHGSGGGTALESKNVNFTIMPWNLIFFILGCLGAAFAGYIFYLTGRHRIRDTWETYTVRIGDNIIGIAKNFNSKWKKLARVNKIKSPFILNEGQKMKVPKQTKQPAPHQSSPIVPPADKADGKSADKNNNHE